MQMQFDTVTYKEGAPVFFGKTAAFMPNTAAEMRVLNIYPEVTYQNFSGFGAALTESAAYTFLQADKAAQDEILSEAFGAGSAGYTALRLAIDSCDFSLGNYSAADGESGGVLSSFSLKRDEEYILPVLRRIWEYTGGLRLMFSPWSPPAFMKTNGQKNGGGSLLPRYRQLWAAYICRYISEYRRLGFPAAMLTVQNEPAATQTWDSCVYTANEEKEFLRDFLYPALQAEGLGDVGIYIWDHNKERVYERAAAILDDTTLPMVKGVAFHWYAGDHFDALNLVRRRFPDHQLIFTEGCVEYSLHSAADQTANAEMYAHDIMGNLNAGMNLSLDWNLLLNEDGGPNHVGNYCDAPLMYNTKTKTLQKNLSIHYISQFSRYIRPGAVRVATTCYTAALENTAFINPDGSLVLVLLNRTDAPIQAVLRTGGKTAELTVPAHSMASGRTIKSKR